jgi:hypothetical protein
VVEKIARQTSGAIIQESEKKAMSNFSSLRRWPTILPGARASRKSSKKSEG